MKFIEMKLILDFVDPNLSLQRLDLPVNAVATALKNFFADLSEPVIPPEFYDELMQTMAVTNPETRLHLLREILNRLPIENHHLLRYFIAHLRRYFFLRIFFTNIFLRIFNEFFLNEFLKKM